jgi:hypothetical protein
MMDNSTEAVDRPMQMDAIKKMLEKPGSQRPCRYMLSGDVSYKLCPNLYQCKTCSFNEEMQEQIEAKAEKLAKRLRKVKARKQNQVIHE